MSRLTSVFAALILLFASTASWALGLGSLVSKSALNQPFSGEIQLYDAKADELDSVQARLASSDEFKKVSVPRPFFLTELKFEPGLNGDGDPVIRVSSPNPIREPFMDFLVEVVWPRGRIIKEYTILLDPPRAGVEAPEVVVKGQLVLSEEREAPPVEDLPVEDSASVAEASAGPSSTEQVAAPKTAVEEAAPVPAVAAPTVVEEVMTQEETIPAEVVQETVLPLDEPVAELGEDVVETAPTQKVPAAEEGFPIRYGPVPAGTGLWRVAKTIAPKDATVAQVALALYRCNPKAFGGGSINGLVTGSKLVIPSSAELYALDPDEASREFSAALAGKPVRSEPLAPGGAAPKATATSVAAAEEVSPPVKKKPDAPRLAEPEDQVAASPSQPDKGRKTEPKAAQPPTEPAPATETSAVTAEESTEPEPEPVTAEQAAVARKAQLAEAWSDSRETEPASPSQPVDAPAADETPAEPDASPLPVDASSTPAEPAVDPAEAAMRQRIQELEAQLSRLGSQEEKAETAEETPAADAKGGLDTIVIVAFAAVVGLVLIGFLGYLGVRALLDRRKAGAEPSDEDDEIEDLASEAVQTVKPEPAAPSELPKPRSDQLPQQTDAAGAKKTAVRESTAAAAAGVAAAAIAEAAPTPEAPPSVAQEIPEPLAPIDEIPMPVAEPAAPVEPPEAMPSAAPELDDFQLDLKDPQAMNLDFSFPDSGDGAEQKAAAVEDFEVSPFDEPAGESGAEKLAEAEQRDASLDRAQIGPAEPDMDVSLPLVDLDQQLAGVELGESAFADLDALERLEEDLDLLGADQNEDDDRAGEDAGSDELEALDILDEPLADPEPRQQSTLERATEAARAGRGRDPFEELVEAELGGDQLDDELELAPVEAGSQPEPIPVLDETPAPEPEPLPELEPEPEALSLPDLDIEPEPEPISGQAEQAEPEAAVDEVPADLDLTIQEIVESPADAEPKLAAGSGDGGLNLAADIDNFLAKDQGLAQEDDIGLDASSEAGFDTMVLPSSAPPGQSPSSSIPELDLELEDLDSLGGDDQGAGDLPDLGEAPVPAAPEPALESSSSGKGGMFGDESLMAPDSGASDVLSSQWRMDSGLWDEVATKMDLAYAYIEMEDGEAARAILEEVIREGNDDQRTEAEALLKKLDG